jgi:ribosomal protein L22
VEKLVTHYNSWANDNSMHGTRPASITRYVLGPAETKAIAIHIAKQPTSTAKALLRELSKRINQADDRGFDPKRIYVEPKAEKLLEAVAKKVGLTLDFKGDPKAPKFDYF